MGQGGACKLGASISALTALASATIRRNTETTHRHTQQVASHAKWKNHTITQVGHQAALRRPQGAPGGSSERGAQGKARGGGGKRGEKILEDFFLLEGSKAFRRHLKAQGFSERV